MNRKTFLSSLVLGVAGIASAPARSLPRQEAKPAPYKPDLIREFVAAGHNNLNRVKEMLAEYPNLIFGTWDWGGGDFETALGGAGHTGNQEIAEFLITQGARIDLFALTMLGKADLVKPVLEEFPDLVFAKGPHGFTLLHHAKQGGEPAAGLVDYLREKGLRETKVKIYG